MTIRQLGLSVIIFILLTQPLLLFGQSASDHGDWSAVELSLLGYVRRESALLH